MTDKLAIIDIIGADKWNRITGNIADLVSESPSVEELTRNQISNIFEQIWYTGDLSGEFGDLGEDDHDLLSEVVHQKIERQVTGGA